MTWKNEWKKLGLMLGVFVGCFYLPIGNVRFNNAILEALHLVKWYTREHVILCLIPAFFIAGAISVFIDQGAVMRYLGAQAKKIVAYSVAAISGTILAVCSCTVLPLFAGIYKMGAGLGPACAFLYSGPAINVLAIALTARILGPELGIARTIGAIVFSFVLGIAMHLIFRKEEAARQGHAAALPASESGERKLWHNALYFGTMVGILVFANWGKGDSSGGISDLIYHWKWPLAGLFALGLGAVLVAWFKVKIWKIGIIGLGVIALALLFPKLPLLPFSAGTIGLSILFAESKNNENERWLAATWGFAKQILPLLLFGVIAAGFFLGRVGQEGIIQSSWVATAVGGNSLLANFCASFLGAFMYFATLTEVPILQGLIANGMGKGPALALLLAGPALSLPNMLVIRSILGTKKTVVFISLVIVMATISGIIFGAFWG